MIWPWHIGVKRKCQTGHHVLGLTNHGELSLVTSQIFLLKSFFFIQNVEQVFIKSAWSTGIGIFQIGCSWMWALNNTNNDGFPHVFLRKATLG